MLVCEDTNEGVVILHQKKKIKLFLSNTKNAATGKFKLVLARELYKLLRNRNRLSTI